MVNVPLFAELDAPVMVMELPTRPALMLVRPVRVRTGEANDPKVPLMPHPVIDQPMDPLFASGKAPVTFVT